MDLEEIISALNLVDSRISSLVEDGEYVDEELYVIAVVGNSSVYIEGEPTRAVYRIFAQYFENVEDGKPIIQHEDYEETYKSSKENFDCLIYKKIDHAKLKAMAEIRRATEAEPKVTNDLSKAADSGNGKLVGLDFRLKTLGSLTRKIRKEPYKNMRDVLRYTEVSTASNQVADYRKTMETLVSAGYRISSVKNSWNDPLRAYNGLNTNVVSPDGYEFELQFHTKESFDLKNGELHSLYEQQRVLDRKKDIEEWQRLEDEMFGLSSTLERPQGIESIGI